MEDEDDNNNNNVRNQRPRIGEVVQQQPLRQQMPADGLINQADESWMPKQRIVPINLRVNASETAQIRGIDQILNPPALDLGGDDDSDSEDDDDDLGQPSFMNLSELTSRGTNYEGQFSAIIICYMTKIKLVNNIQVSQYQRGGNNQGNRRQQTVPGQQRIMTFICPHSPNGQNVFAMIQERSSTNLFSNDTSQRDFGIIRPGTAWLIQAPQVSTMMNNGIPVVHTHLPMIRLLNNLELPERLPVDETTNEQGIVLRGCQVVPRSANYTVCNCSGSMCDLQDFAFNYGRSGAQTCACFRGTNTGVQCYPGLGVSVTAPNHPEQILVEGFLSKHFCDTFLFQSERPARVIPRHFHANQVAVMKIFKKCFKFINERGGWTVVMWSKQAMVDDQGGQQDQGNNPNQRAQQVEAGQANYHIVSMEPTFPNTVDRARFERKRLDLNALAMNAV